MAHTLEITKEIEGVNASHIKKEPANAAIYYHPDGFDTNVSKLMGRQAAGESFLKGWAKHSGLTDFYCFSASKRYAEGFHENIQRYTSKSIKTHWVAFDKLNKLSEPECLFLPGPGIAKQAWQRRYFEQKAYSVCGITHTTASDRVMDSIGDILIAPVQPWDALICTSPSVKEMVKKVLNNHFEYLCDRFETVIPDSIIQLPVIPLGIESSEYEVSEEKKKNATQLKQKLGINPKDVTVLFVGRLSFHAKAHPFPLYQSLENACRDSNQKTNLIMSGWFANEQIEKQFVETAKAFCPNVNVIFVDGRKPEIRSNIWTIADIFCSLSDNIQETFGITPIEAMAAGIPVIVSDWDGYRDSITEQVGFKIPTMMPLEGTGSDLSFRYETGTDNYDMYIGQISLSTGLDIAACSEAFKRLLESKELRQRMGEQGKRLVQEKFDWSVVIPQYQDLWGQLSELRKLSLEVAENKSGTSNPLRSDPYKLFSHYASSTISANTRVSLDSKNFSIQKLDKIMSFSMNTYGLRVFANPKPIVEYLLKYNEVLVKQIIQEHSQESEDWIIRTIGWLYKMGIVQLSN